MRATLNSRRGPLPDRLSPMSWLMSLTMQMILSVHTATVRLRVAAHRPFALAGLLAIAFPLAAVAQAAPAVVAPATTRAADPPRCPFTLVEKLGRLVSANGVDIAWRPMPSPIVVGKPFAVEFEVCPRGAQRDIGRIALDATMPEHRHGMNYRPSLTGQPPGVMRADGLIFHMPGRWQLVFDVQIGGQSQRITDDVVVR